MTNQFTAARREGGRERRLQALALSTFAFVATSISITGLAQAKAVGTNAIRSIESKVSGAEREIVIHTSKSPTFSVFRMSDPFRILVDVSDAQPPKGSELLRFDDGLLRHVSTHAFADELSAIVRVEIALESARPYDVVAKGDDIVVKFSAATETQATKDEPAVPSDSSASSTTLGKLTKQSRAGSVILQTKLKGPAPAADAVKIEHVEGPSRLVVDINGVVAQPKWQTLAVRELGVTRARVGARPEGVRVVLDLDDGAALPTVKVDAVKERLEIAIAAAPKAPVEVTEAKAETPKVETAKAADPTPAIRLEDVGAAKAEKPAVAEAPKAEKKIEQPAPATPVVTDLKVEPKDGFVRLSVELSKEGANVVKDRATTKGAPVLRLTGASLPESLVRTLDTTALAGQVVTAISTYNENGDVIIAANVGGETEHRHWTKGNRMYWDFRGKAGTTQPETADARVLQYPTEATSGFEGDALSVANTITGQRRGYSGRRISLDLKDADIHNVLRLLADVSKLNIVAADDVNGKITLKLRNVPWDQALDIILRAKQLDKTRNGNIIRVAPITVLEKEEQIRLARREAAEKLEPMSVRLIPVSYAVAGAIKPQVGALLSSRGKVNIDERTNVLIVEDIAEVLLKVERLVRTLDTQTPQVLIEARIVEASTNFSRELGIQWGGNVTMAQQFGTSTGLAFPNSIRIAGGADGGQTPTDGVLTLDNEFAVNLPASVGSGAGGALGFVFGSAGGSTLLSLRLSAAERAGKGKIISSPKIVTLDNKEAKILSGEKIPITVITANGPSTRFVDANIELGVTPHVTSDGSILMSIEAKKNELSDRRDLLGTPGIISREAKTEMLVRDGDTAVLGGIYRRTALESQSYVPWIGQIPVLGWIFKTTRRTDSREELLVFISPRIVNRAQSQIQVK